MFVLTDKNLFLQDTESLHFYKLLAVFFRIKQSYAVCPLFFHNGKDTIRGQRSRWMLPRRKKRVWNVGGGVWRLAWKPKGGKDWTTRSKQVLNSYKIERKQGNSNSASKNPVYLSDMKSKSVTLLCFSHSLKLPPDEP